jgi:hypothetical protein
MPFGRRMVSSGRGDAGPGVGEESVRVWPCRGGDGRGWRFQRIKGLAVGRRANQAPRVGMAGEGMERPAGGRIRRVRPPGLRRIRLWAEGQRSRPPGGPRNELWANDTEQERRRTGLECGSRSVSATPKGEIRRREFAIKRADVVVVGGSAAGLTVATVQKMPCRLSARMVICRRILVGRPGELFGDAHLSASRSEGSMDVCPHLTNPRSECDP